MRYINIKDTFFVGIISILLCAQYALATPSFPDKVFHIKCTDSKQLTIQLDLLSDVNPKNLEPMREMGIASVAGLARVEDGDQLYSRPFVGQISSRYNYGGVVDVHLIQSAGTSAETQNRLLIFRSSNEANYGSNNNSLHCQGDFLN